MVEGVKVEAEGREAAVMTHDYRNVDLRATIGGSTFSIGIVGL